jgi:tetratricopeptide (TPR) repeat protein
MIAKYMLRAAAAALSLVALGALARDVRADNSLAAIERGSTLITGHDLDEAKKVLEAADPNNPVVAAELGRLALYAGDCDKAAEIFSRPDIAKLEAVARTADVSRGCARATAATVVMKDEAQGVEIRFQDEHDQALFPLLVETTVKARDMLARDLGASWPKPTRITVVRDLLSLSAMTGLPYEAARTTGTVAVAKWGRVTMLSPRASQHGYPWRDTLAHELTHLAVTRQSLDRAPLWLQEGVAKNHETRWREPGPFDDRPPVDVVVRRGIDRKLDLPLDKLGPSIAMLPSADAAMVAFAEVTSFVAFMIQKSGRETLPKFLVALRTDPVDDALKRTTGLRLAEWDKEWRAELLRRKVEPEVQTTLAAARDPFRLGELLLGRNHPKEALAQLDRLPKEAFEDPMIRYVRARALEGAGKKDEAQAFVREAKDVSHSFGPWLAIRGRLVGMDPSSSAFADAIADDPFSVEAACGVLSAPPSPTGLCAAAVSAGIPDVGRE